MRSDGRFCCHGLETVWITPRQKIFSPITRLRAMRYGIPYTEGCGAVVERALSACQIMELPREMRQVAKGRKLSTICPQDRG